MKLYILITLILFIMYTLNSSCYAEANNNKLLQNIRIELLKKISDIKSVKSKVDEISIFYNEKGYWNDLINDSLNFTDDNSSNAHLDRIYQLVVAYIHPNSFLKNDSIIKQEIRATLSFWNQKKYRSSNWWYNDIGYPQIIGKILILCNFTDLLTGEISDILLNYIGPKSYTSHDTGANDLDRRIHYLYKGVITNDAQLITSTMNDIYDLLEYTTIEGIQKDLSFHQHGNQLHLTGYGDVFVQNMLFVINCTKGTEYEPSKEKFKIFIDLLFDGFCKTILGSCFDYNAGGRQLSRNNGLNSHIIQYYFDTCIQLTSQQEILNKIEEYRKYYEQRTWNTIFWRSDYMIHTRKDYTFSVRSSSERTMKAEKGNGENLLGSLLSSGTTSLRRKGDEYKNIFPVWDWSKIPGVTSTDIIPAFARDWEWRGSGEYIGGVSDGIRGAMVTFVDYNWYRVNVRKGYFCFDEEVVCLGTQVLSEDKLETHTTVEQCLLNGDVEHINKSIKSKLNKNSTLTDSLTSVTHNNVYYYFPKGGVIRVSNEERSGSWKNINNGQSDKKIDKEVFTLEIVHNADGTAPNYVYVIVPNASSDYNTDHLIIFNDSGLQLVINTKEKIAQFIFYHKTSYSDDILSISSEESVTGMIVNYGTEDERIYLADPTQKSKRKKICYNGKVYEADMPQEDMAGSTVEVNAKSEITSSL